jgi:hypothetical protein
LPRANLVAVREHRRWTAARITRSGNGTRSAVPMIRDTKLMSLIPFAAKNPLTASNAMDL